MSPDVMQQLVDLNREINELAFVDPPPSEAWNVWRDTPVPGASWVCRDYVLLKAIRLHAIGWPQPDLTVIECYCEPNQNGSPREYHSVLGVLDPEDGQTWIMDSRIELPYRLSAPLPPADQYLWDRRQIPGTTDLAPMT